MTRHRLASLLVALLLAPLAGLSAAAEPADGLVVYPPVPVIHTDPSPCSPLRLSILA